jgi:hypothetical protein
MQALHAAGMNPRAKLEQIKGAVKEAHALATAEKHGMQQYLQNTHGQFMTGKRGGKYYVSKRGIKVYLGKGHAAQ